VAGDQTIHGGQQATIASAADALAALPVLREAIAAAALPDADRRTAEAHVDAMDAQLRSPRPDKPSIADRLTRVTQTLVAAGALVTGGTALAQTLGGLAMWLGTLGAGVVGLLGSVRGGSGER
jgi:hypothetical protein